MSKQVIEIITNLSKGKYLTLNGKPVGLSEVSDIMNSQQKEIERLNNIINELEKWLNKKYDEIDKKRLGSNLQEELQICSYLAIYETILKKLQELKGDGSNE